MPKFRINLISSTGKPPLAEFIDGKWVIKTAYPDPLSPAGTCLVLSPDGSVDQITFDDEGYIIREVNVKKVPKSD